MTDTNADASRSETSEKASKTSVTCKFKRVLLPGLPPRMNQVEALMKSLESRGVLGPPEEGHAERAVSRAPETAESRPQPVYESGALATVLPFGPRKTGKDK
jgi:hypothetical protein